MNTVIEVGKLDPYHLLIPGQVIWSKSDWVALYRPWPLSENIEESFTHQSHLGPKKPVLLIERVNNESGPLRGLIIFYEDQQWYVECKYHWKLDERSKRRYQVLGPPHFEVIGAVESGCG